MSNLEDRLAILIDDPDFRKIDKQFRRFNIFEAIGATRGELKHSNFLSFILSPARSHGLGSEFLLQFIRAAVSKQTPAKRIARSIELMVSDLDSAIIHREQDHIDVLIEIRPLKLIVLIENKIGAAVGEGQLARYKNAVRTRYPGHRHLFILLTPDVVEPDEEDFVSLTYAEVAALVDQLIDRNELLGSDIALMLKHYVEMLRRHIVEDKQLADLARKLYERHKEAFDFVLEQRPEPDNLLGVIKDLIVADANLAQDGHSPMILRFAPKDWLQVGDFNACPEARWTHSKRNLLFEVKAAQDRERISIALLSGPAEAPLRKKIHDFALRHPNVFVGFVKPGGVHHTTIFTKDLLSARAAETMESEEKEAALKSAWAEFMAKDFRALTVELTKLLV